MQEETSSLKVTGGYGRLREVKDSDKSLGYGKLRNVMEGYGRGRKVTGGYGRLRKVTGDRSLGYGGYGRSREVTEGYGRLHEVTAVPLPCRSHATSVPCLPLSR